VSNGTSPSLAAPFFVNECRNRSIHIGRQRLACSWQSAVDLQSGRSENAAWVTAFVEQQLFAESVFREETAMIAFILNGDHKEVDVGPEP